MHKPSRYPGPHWERPATSRSSRLGTSKSYRRGQVFTEVLGSLGPLRCWAPVEGQEKLKKTLAPGRVGSRRNTSCWPLGERRGGGGGYQNIHFCSCSLKKLLLNLEILAPPPFPTLYGITVRDGLELPYSANAEVGQGIGRKIKGRSCSNKGGIRLCKSWG